MPYVLFLPKSGLYLTPKFLTTSDIEKALVFEAAETGQTFAHNYNYAGSLAVIVPQYPKYYNCGKFDDLDGALSAIRYFLPLGMYANCEGGKIVISYHEANDYHQKILVNVGNLISAYLENI